MLFAVLAVALPHRFPSEEKHRKTLVADVGPQHIACEVSAIEVPPGGRAAPSETGWYFNLPHSCFGDATATEPDGLYQVRQTRGPDTIWKGQVRLWWSLGPTVGPTCVEREAHAEIDPPECLVGTYGGRPDAQSRRVRARRSEMLA